MEAIQYACKKKIFLLCEKTVFIVVHVENLLFVQEEDQGEDPLLVQEEGLLLVQEEVKEWSPEKLKMVRKRFFPKLSGDPFAIIIDT